VNLRRLLSTRFEDAFHALGLDADNPLVQPASKPEFGDYQANGVMAAAKRRGQNPRKVAEDVVARVELTDLAEPPVIAGPGFINVTLDSHWLATRLAPDAPLMTTVDEPETVVVDYSAPNLAKEMHVGHLRSTIIGDAVVRVLEALGHRVIRQNHVGDWGTQFGMLLTYLAETGVHSDELEDIEEFYRSAKARFDGDPEFAERSRRTVVALQTGDPAALAQWRRFIDISLSHCQSTYERLGTTLTLDDVKAESAYNDALAGIIETLKARNLLADSEGAKVVYLDEFKAKDGSPLGVIVQKSDGGYLYATTDLAAVQHRSAELRADRVIYLTDARQSQHFQQIFTISQLAGLAGPDVSLEHHPFGNMLGKDGRPFRTREGGVVKLNELLDEAVARARRLVAEKDPDLDPEEREHVAQAVGIGAVKYADLSKNRTSNYIFDWDQMLSFEGNTAPYLQYAYARIRSIFRRAGVSPDTLTGTVDITEPSERALAVLLVRFQEVLEQVAEDVYPHYLCGYLFELATAFTRFYEACPILAEGEPVRTSRLLLCARAARTLSEGLALLGIETVERM
jgi:arginyl-tRNA synthetase